MRTLRQPQNQNAPWVGMLYTNMAPKKIICMTLRVPLFPPSTTKSYDTLTNNYVQGYFRSS